MPVLKSGDLVVLKSGSPTMTVDTVNTDVFDDDKVTGILCVWFVGEKLERVRFDLEAVQLAGSLQPAPFEDVKSRAVTTSDYKIVLDEMVAAMNFPAEDCCETSDRFPNQRKAKSAPKRNSSGERSLRGSKAPSSGENLGPDPGSEPT
jgi:uncharacterized protein YodC (DUF2158 family)